MVIKGISGLICKVGSRSCGTLRNSNMLCCIIQHREICTKCTNITISKINTTNRQVMKCFFVKSSRFIYILIIISCIISFSSILRLMPKNTKGHIICNKIFQFTHVFSLSCIVNIKIFFVPVLPKAYMRFSFCIEARIQRPSFPSYLFASTRDDEQLVAVHHNVRIGTFSQLRTRCINNVGTLSRTNNIIDVSEVSFIQLTGNNRCCGWTRKVGATIHQI